MMTRHCAWVPGQGHQVAKLEVSMVVAQGSFKSPIATVCKGLPPWKYTNTVHTSMHDNGRKTGNCRCSHPTLCKALFESRITTTRTTCFISPHRHSRFIHSCNFNTLAPTTGTTSPTFSPLGSGRSMSRLLSSHCMSKEISESSTSCRQATSVSQKSVYAVVLFSHW